MQEYSAYGGNKVGRERQGGGFYLPLSGPQLQCGYDLAYAFF